MSPPPASSRSRRTVLAGIVGITTGLAGCVNVDGIDGGALTIYEMSESPDGATVTDAADANLESVTPVRRGFDRMADPSVGGVVDVDLSRAEYDAVKSAFDGLPYYDRWDHPESDSPSGYYVQYDGTVYCLQYLPYCTDLPGVEAERNGNCWTEPP